MLFVDRGRQQTTVPVNKAIAPFDLPYGVLLRDFSQEQFLSSLRNLRKPAERIRLSRVCSEVEKVFATRFVLANPEGFR